MLDNLTDLLYLKIYTVKKCMKATTEMPLGVDVRDEGWASYSSNNVVGIGLSNTYNIEFNNCVFENGLITAHTVASSSVYAITNAHFHLNGCKLVNSYIKLQTAGTLGLYNVNGKYTCHINNLTTQKR